MPITIELDDPSYASLDGIKKKLSTISPLETQLELISDFSPNRRFDHKLVAEHLSALAPHLKSVIFEISLVYLSLPNENSSAPDKNVYTITLGSCIFEYIPALADNVEEVCFIFKDNVGIQDADSTLYPNLLQLLALLKPTISRLNLSCAMRFIPIGQQASVLEKVPSFVTFLTIGGSSLYQYDTNFRTSKMPARNLKALDKNLHHLNASCVNFRGQGSPYTISGPLYEVFASDLPPGLKSLDLSYHRLHITNEEFVARLPDSIERLILISTLGMTFTYANRNNNQGNYLLSQLRKLKPGVRYLDLSNNHLLTVGLSIFSKFFSYCPTTVKALRLCDNTSEVTRDHVIKQYEALPSLETLVLTNCKYLGRSLPDFAEIVATLKGIKELDLSDNEFFNLLKVSFFGNLIEDDFILLASKIPPVPKLKLCRNRLYVYSEKALSALPKDIEIDLSGNGFETLPNPLLNKRLDALPDGLIHFDESSFCLTPYGHLMTVSQQGALRLRHQNNFAALSSSLIGLMKAKKKLGLDHFAYLCTFLFNQSIHQLKKSLTKLSHIIPDDTKQKQLKALGLPTSIFSPTEANTRIKECIAALNYRIQTLRPHDSCLNLSHCGLHRLSIQELMDGLHLKIPERITSIRLRANGFLNDPDCLQKLIIILKAMPLHIQYVDLSVNGFKEMPKSDKEAFLLQIPNHLLISLNPEEVMSPTDQIKQCTTLTAYEYCLSHLQSFYSSLLSFQLLTAWSRKNQEDLLGAPDKKPNISLGNAWMGLFSPKTSLNCDAVREEKKCAL